MENSFIKEKELFDTTHALENHSPVIPENFQQSRPFTEQSYDLSVSNISDSYLSIDTSLELEDEAYDGNKIKDIDNVGQIQNFNQSIKQTIQGTLKNFQMASKEFHQFSDINANRTSVLINELENMKKVMTEMTNFSRSQSSINSSAEYLISDSEINSMKEVYEQIVKLQSEIQTAWDALIESEKLLENTEEETGNLTNELKQLELSLNNAISSQAHKCSHPTCKCNRF